MTDSRRSTIAGSFTSVIPTLHTSSRGALRSVMETTPLDSSGRTRREWWDGGWQEVEGVRRERRHLVLLSMLGGIVFFGAGCWGASAVTSRRPRSLQSSHVLYSPKSSDISKTGVELAQDVQDLDLKVRSYNAYTKDHPIELYPWEHLAEPYKPNVLELLDWPASGDDIEYR